MIKLKHKKNNSMLAVALVAFLYYVMKTSLAKEFSLTNSISLFPILFFLVLHFYIRWSYYILITKDKIVKNNVLYKEKIILNEIIEKRIKGGNYILKTSSKTFKININFMNSTSFKQLYKELDKLDL